MCGLWEIADETVSSLSTGQRRMVELARAIACPFGVLLLDEPSAGLDREETRHFGEVLRHVVSSRGLGILLVEHDMGLVMDICDHIYVLEFGSVLFQGSPEAVQGSDLVKAAYLGAQVADAAVTVGVAGGSDGAARD
jgi:ABC-type branched-subunit amino acid transport system ATPase component